MDLKRAGLLPVAALVIVFTGCSSESGAIYSTRTPVPPPTASPVPITTAAPSLTHGEVVAKVQQFLGAIQTSTGTSCLAFTRARFELNNPRFTYREGVWLVVAERKSPPDYDLNPNPVLVQSWEVYESSGLVRSLNDRGC